MVIQAMLETVRPSMKCSRVGHAYRLKRKMIRRVSTDPTYVMVDISADFNVCARCKRTRGPFNEAVVSTMKSCLMGLDDIEKIKQDGYIIISG
jgi:hypothetical protein